MPRTSSLVTCTCTTYYGKIERCSQAKVVGRIKIVQAKFWAFVGLPFSNDANSGRLFPFLPLAEPNVGKQTQNPCTLRWHLVKFYSSSKGNFRCPRHASRLRSHSF